MGPAVAPGELDPLELLAREDKWFLGGGRGLIWAPPFPLHLDRPGFWDAAHYLHFAWEPVFTWTLVDRNLRELSLLAVGRSWRPDRLVQRYTAGELEIEETRVLSGEDALVSVVCVRNTGAQTRELHAVGWTAQPVSPNAATSNGEAGTATAALAGGIERYERREQVLLLGRTVAGARDQRLLLNLALGLSDAESFCATLSEPTANQPHWKLAPFYESLSAAGLPNREQLGGVTPGGIVYLGLERTLRIAPGASISFSVAGAVNSDLEAAFAGARAALASPAIVAGAERAWRAYFDGVPRFRCSDQRLERYYYYRWYGLRLNTIDVREGNYRHPLVCEGIGYFHLPISYSAPAHLRETRWAHDPELAFGILRTYLENQTTIGTFPAHLYRNWSSPREIYHADWGAALLDVFALHPAPELLAPLYRALAAYGEHFVSTRDDNGLYRIVTQWETGQEYMSRYMAVDPAADEWRPMAHALTGVDASVYMLRVWQALEQLAPKVGAPGEAARWRELAERTAWALRERCWDEQDQAFHDLTPAGERVPTLHGTSFYPYFTGVATSEHLPGLRRNLLDPAHFWTPFPVPSSALDDPYFSALPEWKGKRHNCPWNGRTWPMVNSHIAEALLRAATIDPSLRQVAAEFVTRFVHMLFEDGDPGLPNSFEHYHPFSGRASTYRGIDDYQHSWIVDLLIRFVAGLRPEEDRVVVDPLPFGVPFSLERAYVRGRWIDIVYDPDGGLRVYVDGVEVAHRSQPEAIELSL